MLFEWSDNSHVTFTQWATAEPSHASNLQEDCVLIRGQVAPVTHQKSNGSMKLMLMKVKMTLVFLSSVCYTQNGRWEDHMCEKTFGYICKKKASTRPAEGTHEEANPGCKPVRDVISFLVQV